MKLLTLNIEGQRHYERVRALLVAEQADVLCLQEVPEDLLPQLQALGYQVSKALRCVKAQDGERYNDYVVFASKAPHEAQVYAYYEHSGEPDDVYDAELGRRHNHQVVVVGTVLVAGEEFVVATTHATWTPDGMPTPAQTQDIAALVAYSAQLPPHILCGDMNIPRHKNKLYDTLCESYADVVPAESKTSLDASHHRIMQDATQAHIVDEFMVDYIFTQTPYVVSGVRQVFDVSDHAATVAEITRR